IPVTSAYIVHCYVKSLVDLNIDLETHVKNLLQLVIPPNDNLGVAYSITSHLLVILAKIEIKVTETLAVIGFANTDLGLSLNPSLSTIRQPTSEIGEISVNKLVEIMQKKNRSQIEWEDIKLPTSIQLRRSTIG